METRTCFQIRLLLIAPCRTFVPQNIPVPSVRKALGEDGDVQRVQREYNRQRGQMERNVETLKRKIEKVRYC